MQKPVCCMGEDLGRKTIPRSQVAGPEALPVFAPKPASVFRRVFCGIPRCPHFPQALIRRRLIQDLISLREKTPERPVSWTVSHRAIRSRVASLACASRLRPWPYAMEITVAKKDLLKRLARVGSVTERRSTMQALSNVLFTADGQELRLFATDNAMAMAGIINR